MKVIYPYLQTVDNRDPGLPTRVRLEVERVQVLDVAEGEDPSEGQQQVEQQDQQVVSRQQLRGEKVKVLTLQASFQVLTLEATF